MFSIIVAIGKNNEIGKNNKLLWNIPEDLKNFREITSGKTVIMGRKTYESIGKPLPNRQNIILTRDINSIKNDKLEVYDSFEEVIEKYKNTDKEVFIIGGEQIYKKALDLGIINKMYISYIDFEDENADAYFPKIEKEKWKIINEKKYENWKFLVYEKR